MRNLKKVLALVLSLVMALSMVTIASAAVPGTAFSDDAAITEFDEAVQVLEALGVLQGRDTAVENVKALDPNAEITRAEAAAVVYRAITGDVTDANIAMFADELVDVPVTHWAAGYIGYCVNHGILKGFEDGTFRPNEKVTGYQVMAMILRSLGYGAWGEFTGKDWQSETAAYWNLAGITNSVNQAALRKNASRALVAELVFRAISEASTVVYNALYKYENTNQTKGWEIFGLNGVAGVNNILKNNEPAGYESNAGYTEATDLAAMIERADAIVNPDSYEVRYGEPVAYWYRDTNKDGTSDLPISVHFNPIKTYSTVVTDDTLFADAVLPASWANTTLQSYTEDGANVLNAGVNDVIYKAAASAPALTYGGKGTVLELYKADNMLFLVEKNTYVARVNNAYAAVPLDADVALALKADNTLPTGGIDYKNWGSAAVNGADYGSGAPYGLDNGLWERRLATLAGLTTNTVVTFHVYNDGDGDGTLTTNAFIDHTTIKAAATKNSVVTWTYDTGDAKTSWFIGDGATYEYNEKFVETDSNNVTGGGWTGGGLDHYLESVILNRDQLSFDRSAGTTTTPLVVDAFDPNQTLYLDQFGYVVHVTDQAPDAISTGYMVLTSATFNNYAADNGWYLNLTGYNAAGELKTVKGGIETYAYGEPGVANNVAYQQFNKGIYYFVYDKNLDLYRFEALDTGVMGTFGTGKNADTAKNDAIANNANTGAGTIADTAANNETAKFPVMAGDADALHATTIVDDETVFVIPNYSTYGMITGYNVVKGFKNIPDLYDANEDLWNVTGNTSWKVQWVDSDAVAENAAVNKTKTIDLVYVEGARQVADSIGTARDGSNSFVLLDRVPQDFVVTYDSHPVVMGGMVQPLKLAPNMVVAVGSDGDSSALTNPDTVAGGSTQLVADDANGGVWTINTRGGADQWVTSVKEDSTAATDTGIAKAPLAYRAPGVLHDGTNYITMASNCQVYRVNLTTKTSTLMTDLQIAGLSGALQGCVVGTDVYGFATLIYVIG